MRTWGITRCGWREENSDNLFRDKASAAILDVSGICETEYMQVYL